MSEIQKYLSCRFILSHHKREHEHRCVILFGYPLCARCLGMYPSMGAGLIILFFFNSQHPGIIDFTVIDGILLTSLAVPASADWIRGRINPKSGTNFFRIFSGLLLGFALAGGIFMHAVEPFQKAALDLFIFLGAVAVVGEISGHALGVEPSPYYRDDRDNNFKYKDNLLYDSDIRKDPNADPDVIIPNGHEMRPDDR